MREDEHCDRVLSSSVDNCCRVFIRSCYQFSSNISQRSIGSKLRNGKMTTGGVWCDLGIRPRRCKPVASVTCLRQRYRRQRTFRPADHPKRAWGAPLSLFSFLLPRDVLIKIRFFSLKKTDEVKISPLHHSGDVN